MISTTVPPTTLDISGVTADVTAIKAVTDNLPNSGALTNLDQAISSVQYPVQTAIYAMDAVPADISGLNAISPGVSFGSLTVSAAGYTEVLSVNAPGIIWWASCWRGAAFTSGTLNMRVTIDGEVAVLTGATANSTILYAGVIGVGSYAGTVPLLMPLRFKNSMKIEVTSSAAQSGGGDIYGSYIYTLD